MEPIQTSEIGEEELRSLWQLKVATAHSGTHLTAQPYRPYQPPRYRRGPNRLPQRRRVHKQLPARRLRIWRHTQARSRVTLRRRLEAGPRFRPSRRSSRRQTCRRRTTDNRISQSSPSHPFQRRNPPPVRPRRNPSLPQLRGLRRPLRPLMPLPGRTQVRYRRRRSRPVPLEIPKPLRQPPRNLCSLNPNHPLTR